MPKGAHDQTFQASVNQGLQLHDRAEKRRQADPAAACALYREAIAAYQTAEDQLPADQNSVELRFNMGVAHSGLANCIKEMETRNWKQQYQEALCVATTQYAEVVEEDSTHHEAMNNWGAALHSLAEISARSEALAFLESASEKLEMASALAPADFEAANNHADALAAWAALLARDDAGNVVCSPESETLWARAYERYSTSMASMNYDYDRVNCLCNWSTALSKHAELKQERGDKEGAYALFIAAADTLSQSLQRQPDPDGYVALAEAQKSAAENAEAHVQEEGLLHVCASYAQALRINAAHPEAVAGLGETLLDHARLMLAQQTRQEEAQATLTRAGELLFQYVSMPGREADDTALHNLACVCSLLGRESECRKYLERCGRVQMMRGSDMQAWCAEVTSDEDLANARLAPWFLEMLAAAQTGFGALQS